MPGLCVGVFLWAISTVYGVGMGYIEQPTSQSAVIGESVTLRCKVSNKGLNRLYWQKLDKTGYKFISMDGNIDPYGLYNQDLKARYSVGGDHTLGEYNLRIERLKIDDSGRFACVYFEEGFGRYSTIANISVVWPATDPPQCQVTFSASSRRVSLICLSRGGQPLATLAWQNGNTQLTGSAHKTNDVSLNIFQPGTKTYTESSFMCVATSPALTNPQTCSVLPVYIDWHRTPLYIGDNVLFTCTIFSNENNLIVSWLIGGKQVSNSGRLIEFKDDKRKLMIYDLSMSDNQLKVTCIVQNQDGLKGNASDILDILNQKAAVNQSVLTTQSTLTRTTLNVGNRQTTSIATTNQVEIKLPNYNETTVTSSIPRTTLSKYFTVAFNFSAVTFLSDGNLDPPLEVGDDGNSNLLYKGFMSSVSIITFLLIMLVITFGLRFHKERKSREAERRQLGEKCVPMVGVLSDMATESKRSDNGDSGISSYGTEIESHLDCTMEYKHTKLMVSPFPDLIIISQDIKSANEKYEEPIYMSLNNCRDGESEDEKVDEKINYSDIQPVYMMLDRDAEQRDEVYSCVDIGNTIRDTDVKAVNTDTHKHLYAVLENNTTCGTIMKTRSDLIDSDLCNSGYSSGESPCEYEEVGLPERLTCTQNTYQEPPSAYAVTNLMQVERPLHLSVKKTLWQKLTRSNSHNLKQKKQIPNRSLPNPLCRPTDGIKTNSDHEALTKTFSCPPRVAKNMELISRGSPNGSPLQLRRSMNMHFMANRPLISRPIFRRTVSTDNGIVVTDDYAELEITNSLSESQTDDTYESLDEYAVVKKSPAKKKLQRASERTPVFQRSSPSFRGRQLPSIENDTPCHRCGSPNMDRGFFSSSSEEELSTAGPPTPPRILKNYKLINQLQNDDTRLKRATWPNRIDATDLEKHRDHTTVYGLED